MVNATPRVYVAHTVKNSKGEKLSPYLTQYTAYTAMVSVKQLLVPAAFADEISSRYAVLSSR